MCDFQSQSIGRQTKVTLWVVFGVGYQPNMRDLRTGFEARRTVSRKNKIRHIHIARRYPEHLFQQWQGAHYAACGFQSLARSPTFMRIKQLHLF